MRGVHLKQPSGVGTNSLSNPSVRPFSSSDLIHLRPCTGLEMMDRAFTLLRTRASLLFGLGALGGLMTLQASLLQNREDSGYVLAGTALRFIAMWPLAAALAAAFQMLLLPRRRLGAWAAMRGAAGRLPHLLLTAFLSQAVLGLMLVVAYQLLRSPAGGWNFDRGNWALAGVMGTLVMYLAALWALAPAVVLLEGRMLFDALFRSAELMRQRFTTTLFGDSAIRRLVVLMTVAVFVTVLPQLTVPLLRWVLVGMPLPTLAGSSMVDPAAAFWEGAELAVAAILTCFLWPYIQTGIAVLYAECRVRREALDLQTRLIARESNE